jgi:CxxC motif-containing protein (DUF1111 family)
MTCLRPGYYLLGALLLLGPVGLRMATRTDPPPQTIDQEAVVAGRVLFTHEFTPNDPLCQGDGLGPVFNAKSCVACHFKGGIGGSGENKHNVTNFVKRERNAVDPQGVVHTFATETRYQETLAHVGLQGQGVPTFEIVQRLSKQGAQMGLPSVSQRNTPALFGAKLIDDLPDRVIIANERMQRVGGGLAAPGNEQATVGRALRLPNGHIGKFGWKAQSATLADFVQAACANELGLSNPGAAQPRPLGQPGYQAPAGFDLTAEQCRQMTMFVAALDRPKEIVPAVREDQERAHAGKRLFTNIGCANCHTPTLGSVEGLYSDLLLHRMGSDLEGQGSYNGPVPPPDSPGDDSPRPDEWRTPPLWGVASSGPYLHDGRANSLTEAIALHGGQGRAAADRFQRLSESQKAQLIGFLHTLQAPR